MRGGMVGPLTAPMPPTPAAGAGARASAQVSGRIELDPALLGQVPAGAALFVYAYAVDGPRVPLALRQHAASDLPLAFSLDDSLAVNPAFRLSMAPQVVVGARIGAAGATITAAPGDLVGSSGPVMLGAHDLRIVIKDKVPAGARP